MNSKKQWELSGKWKYLYALTLACGFVYAVNVHFFEAGSSGRLSTINIFLLIGVSWFLFHTSGASYSMHVMKCSYGFSFLYGTALVFGEAISSSNSLHPLFASIQSFITTLLSILCFTVVFGKINLWFCRWLGRKFQEKKTPDKLERFFRSGFLFFKFQAILFLCWIPCFISYFPGVFSYDMPYQTAMVKMGIEVYTKHHPPLHTLLWAACLQVQKSIHVDAITFYGVIQMLLLSAAMAWFLCCLVKRKADYRFFIISFLFFAINPVVAVCSFIPAKDMLFAVVFFIFILLACELLEKSAQFELLSKQGIAFMLSLLFCCLLRNNAYYALILCVPFFCLGLRKRWEQVLLLFIIPLLLFQVVDKGLFSGVLKMAPSEPAEMLSIPMEQIATVVVNERENLSEEQLELISTCINVDELVEAYNPRLTDSIKGSFDNAGFVSHKSELVKLWLTLFFRYPGHYINALLSLNMPYWYPDASTLDPYSNRAYVETEIYDSSYVSYKRAGYLPHVNQFYESAASYQLFQNVPVLSNLFSIASPLWFLLAGVFSLFARKKYRTILVTLPSLFLLLTFLAGPVSNFRYIFAIFILYPVYLLVFCLPEKADARHEETLAKRQQRQQ